MPTHPAEDCLIHALKEAYRVDRDTLADPARQATGRTGRTSGLPCVRALSGARRRERVKTWCSAMTLAIVLLISGAGGCGPPRNGPLVIFLDGASHFTAGRSVRAGLEAAGYNGTFKNFIWTSFLGWGTDHLVVARSGAKAKSLAKQIERSRRVNPDGEIHLMGLSAGSAIILGALERLPEDVQVDTVVLFSSSVSANRDLSPALQHVRKMLYATCSKRDLILSSLGITADGTRGRPAGLSGFRIPPGAEPESQQAYAKMVNLYWRPSHVAYGWNGGHVSATSKDFVRSVIAPRVFSKGPYPLDRPLVILPEPD